MKGLLSCETLFATACFDVAQIFNLLYRRIAFGSASGFAGAFGPATASGLQIRDTAEYNSALLRLRLRRAKNKVVFMFARILPRQICRSVAVFAIGFVQQFGQIIFPDFGQRMRAVAARFAAQRDDDGAAIFHALDFAFQNAEFGRVD